MGSHKKTNVRSSDLESCEGNISIKIDCVHQETEFLLVNLFENELNNKRLKRENGWYSRDHLSAVYAKAKKKEKRKEKKKIAKNE